MASRKSRAVLIVSIVATVSVVVLGLAVFFVTRSADRSAHAARFQGNIQQYLAINNEPTEHEAYIKGKILIINKKDKTVDDELFYRLPAADRAASPEEVGTVILVSWGKELAGFYSNNRGDGGGGYVHKCEVTIIDQSISTVIYRRWFNGSLPPLKSTGSGDRYGSRPVQEIVDYLVALPREKSVEAPPPADWMVLFRSDDPSVWNTDSPGAKFAIPMRRVPRSIRFLRIKRMDTGEIQILSVTQKQLAREEKADPADSFWWNGIGQQDWGGRHLGLAQAMPSLNEKNKPIAVSNYNHQWFTGSGFGHRLGVNDRQYYCWQGKEIPKTVFEFAVTAAPLTAAEKTRLMAPDSSDSPPPRGWTVLFRSDDPTLWNTEHPNFAVPACRAHGQVRHLRLKRLDSGEALIVPITRAQLLAQPKPPSEKDIAWNGTGRSEYGGCHLGLVQGPRMDWRDAIAVMYDGSGCFAGSGFGHKTRVDDSQYFAWRGKEIPKTVFEIAVSADPLTEEEKRLLAVPHTPYKPLPRSKPGTPVPNAIAQPKPPPQIAGKLTVDLIPLVDPTKDAVHGRWLVVKDALHCNSMHGGPRIQIPYQPPEEYDFIATFSQPKPRHGVGMIMPNPKGGSFFWSVGGWYCGFGGLKQDSMGGPLAANKAYTTVVQVRRDGVKAFLDGKLLQEHRNNFGELKSDHYHEIQDAKLLAVTCDDPTVFHYVRVVEISGAGKKTR
ncbi:MAG TPA: hypothetical protein VKE98_07060 [Gemmataceae bacterium]|nr:hypothetical protein [Gemmataceae bacterium]